MANNYEVVIGLEIHVQLKTESKMFCRCSNAIALAQKDAEYNADKRGRAEDFAAARKGAEYDAEKRGSVDLHGRGENSRGLKLEEPNTRVCQVCMGMPGVLPVANKKAIEWTILLGLALNAEIPKGFNFERKNYFYPDLPKAYQISSATIPPVRGGLLEIESLRMDSTNSTSSWQASSPQEPQGKPGIKKIRLNHIHLEEDAGKLVHEEGKDYSLVDLNRAGAPLLEIVTEPDLSSPEEAGIFLRSLRGILRYLRISDADMEKGQLRCDANISLKKKGAKELGTKVEIKNLNSFKMVERALAYEVERQSEILDMNNKVVQETRGWNDAKGKSISQRTKEEAMDYRYFSEPDLPPVKIGRHRLNTDHIRDTDLHGSEIDIDELAKLIPELPKEKRERFISEYGLNERDAFTLTAGHELANYFERTIEEFPEIVKGSEIERDRAKKASNWILNELLARLNAKGQTIEETKIKPQQLAELLELIEKETISGKMAKEIFDEMFETGKEPEKIIKQKGLEQVSGEEKLGEIIDKVLRENEKSVEDYKKGKEAALGFLVGQVMKETKGKANPGVVNKLLRERLS